MLAWHVADPGLIPSIPNLDQELFLNAEPGITLCITSYGSKSYGKGKERREDFIKLKQMCTPLGNTVTQDASRHQPGYKAGLQLVLG